MDHWRTKNAIGPIGTTMEHASSTTCAFNATVGTITKSAEGPTPKAFGGNVHNMCFPKHFWVPNNVVKYDSKTNPNI
jgi:hypothetical protein